MYGKSKTVAAGVVLGFFLNKITLMLPTQQMVHFLIVDLGLSGPVVIYGTYVAPKLIIAMGYTVLACLYIARKNTVIRLEYTLLYVLGVVIGSYYRAIPLLVDPDRLVEIFSGPLGVTALRVAITAAVTFLIMVLLTRNKSARQDAPKRVPS